MAGGIDWFRWHHGSVTDPKFALVARRTGASLSDVLAVWAYLLEHASAADVRGTFAPIDFEAWDCLFSFPDGRAKAIHDAMQDRNLVDEGRVTSWEKRQPKKEDETATERKRRQREREHEAAMAAALAASIVTSEVSRDVTPSHADVTPGHAREEERREEKREEISEPSVPRRKPSASVPCPYAEIIGRYHEALPELPAVRLETEARRKAMRAFWAWVLTSKRSDGTPRAADADQALAWIAEYFRRVRQNDFLMGRSGRGDTHSNWRPDLEFLLSDKGKKHVIEKTQEAA